MSIAAAPGSETPPVEPATDPSLGAPPPDAGGDAPAGGTDDVASLPDWAQTHIRELRDESARYRTRGKAFDGWEDEHVEAWSGLLSKAKDDPSAALADLLVEGYGMDRAGALAYIDSVFPDQPAEPAGGDQPAGEDKPLTRAELEKWAADRDATQEQERRQVEELAAIEKSATDLGFEPKASPGSVEEFRYHRLLYLTSQAHGGDMQKASEALAAEEQALIDQYLARKAAEADEAPTPPGGAGAGKPVVAPPSDLKTIRGSVKEKVAKAFGPPPTTP